MYTYVHATFLEIFEHFNPHNDSHNDPSLRVGSSKFEVRRLVSPCISIDLPVTSELYTTFCTQRADREAFSAYIYQTQRRHDPTVSRDPNPSINNSEI